MPPTNSSSLARYIELFPYPCLRLTTRSKSSCFVYRDYLVVSAYTGRDIDRFIFIQKTSRVMKWNYNWKIKKKPKKLEGDWKLMLNSERAIHTACCCNYFDNMSARRSDSRHNHRVIPEKLLILMRPNNSMHFITDIFQM